MDSYDVIVTERHLQSLIGQRDTDFGFWQVVRKVPDDDLALDCVAVKASVFTDEALASLRSGDNLIYTTMLVRTTTRCMPGTWQEYPNVDLENVRVNVGLDLDGAEQARIDAFVSDREASAAQQQRRAEVQRGQMRRKRRGGN